MTNELLKKYKQNEYKSVVCSAVEVAHNGKAILGECPRWDERQKLLYWVDIDHNKLHQFNPKTQQNKTITFKEKVGCFALRENGGFILGMQSGFATLDGFNDNLTYLCDPQSHKPDNRFNDGRCDSTGRFVAGTVNMAKSANDACIYNICHDNPKQANEIVSGLLTSNGIAFSLCNTTMYYSDTPNHILYRGDYNINTGTINNISPFVKFSPGGGRPDGGCVDEQGYYWSALYNGGQVIRISPTGEIVETVAIPAKNCTMLAFGGDDFKTVYVTTASANLSPEQQQKYPNSGAIFRFRTTVAGTLEHRYKG